MKTLLTGAILLTLLGSIGTGLQQFSRQERRLKRVSEVCPWFEDVVQAVEAGKPALIKIPMTDILEQPDAEYEIVFELDDSHVQD